MNISGKITGISYKTLFTKNLKSYHLKDIAKAFTGDTVFFLTIDKDNTFAVSWWVSAKRTRSYPYERVYNTLSYTGKKVTVIPVYKDEGKDGDRDYLQWDTISLMSLLGVYVIISFYEEAKKNNNYANKITDHRYSYNHIKDEMLKLLSYQSDALHWNLEQVNDIGSIAQKALKSYMRISKMLNVKLKSKEKVKQKIDILKKGRKYFINYSRNQAQQAQIRESMTVQPKELLSSGEKAIITIENYLGGKYYFTTDEARYVKNKILLIEGKHSKTSNMPSLSDIKDGLLKMILFTNLKNVIVDGVAISSQAALKLTTKDGFDIKKLSKKQLNIYMTLKKEASENNFILLHS